MGLSSVRGRLDRPRSNNQIEVVNQHFRQFQDEELLSLAPKAAEFGLEFSHSVFRRLPGSPFRFGSLLRGFLGIALFLPIQQVITDHGVVITEAAIVPCLL